MPRSKRRYRTGRFFARLFCLLGFLQIGTGTGAIIIGLLAHFGGGLAVMPAIIATQPPLLAGASGIALAFLGLIQVLFGQLARAVFDQASASRDIAAFNRARTAYDLGTPLAQTPES